jgi:PKD repeat protein
VIPSAQANFNVSIGCSETATIAHFIEPNTTYIWNFGDGNYTSHTLDTFNHTYTRPGFYNITLSAYAENACSSTFNLNTFASDGNTPIANFNYAPACGNNIQFDNLTQFGSGFLWNFGDGSPVVSEYEPYHSFPAAGTYNVTLSTFKSATCMHTITLPVVAPQGWNIKLPKAKMAYYVQPCTNIITAKDSGSLESVNFKWYFNKVFVDTGAQITLPALTPGDYQIMLIADNVYCTDTTVAGIKIQEAPEALFEIIKDACSNTIVVNNLSKNANSYAWDFGDVVSAHNTATGPSASHTYASNGTYNIRLIAFNLTGCSDTIVLPITLTNANSLSKANFNYTYGLCNCECDNYIRFQNLTPGTNTY